jgi:hypothetical protein
MDNSLQGLRPAIPGSDPDGVIYRHNQNLGVFVPPGVRGALDGLGHLFCHFIHNEYFTFDLWQNIDYIFSASVDSARSVWPLKSGDLNTVGPYMPNPRQRFSYIIQL